jgi:hypothetical protein
MSSNSESGSDTNMSTRDSGSDLDFNLEEVNEDVFDNDMEPLATEKEASAYAEEVEREEQNQQELMRRFNREIFIDSW